jgi:hypothetical protein
VLTFTAATGLALDWLKEFLSMVYLPFVVQNEPSLTASISLK